MNARRADILFRMTAVVTMVGAACVLAAAIIAPRPRLTAAGVARAAPSSQPIVVNGMPSAKALALVADVPLRRSLDDPKPLALAAPTSQPATFSATLRGTIVEPGRSFAVFARSAGDVQVCEIGDQIDGADVLAITARDVTLRVGDRSIVLEVPRAPQPIGPPAT